MKLKEYYEQLTKFIEENPDVLDLECYTSSDDEGNGFNAVLYYPSKGYIDEDGGFRDFDQFEEHELEESDVNAVCLN